MPLVDGESFSNTMVIDSLLIFIPPTVYPFILIFAFIYCVITTCAAQNFFHKLMLKIYISYLSLIQNRCRGDLLSNRFENVHPITEIRHSLISFGRKLGVTS